MASLVFENGDRLEEIGSIAAALRPLAITVGHDPDPLPPEILPLLSVVDPTAEQREAILQPLDERLERLRILEPLVSRDLLNLHAEAAGTAEHLGRFSGFHTHADDEGRYIVAGECLFGFVLPGGSQVRLTLHPGDVLRIPAGSEHWFQLTPLHQLKAVRLFSFVDHWVTTPMDRAIAPSLAA